MENLDIGQEVARVQATDSDDQVRNQFCFQLFDSVLAEHCIHNNAYTTVRFCNMC